MSNKVEEDKQSGGLAQFCVEHREVAWLALIAVLVWGGVAYTKLGQQEDPTIPQRTAMLVTQFPGATASKVEELVSKNQRAQIDRRNQDHLPARHLHHDDQTNPCADRHH